VRIGGDLEMLADKFPQVSHPWGHMNPLLIILEITSVWSSTDICVTIAPTLGTS